MVVSLAANTARPVSRTRSPRSCGKCSITPEKQTRLCSSQARSVPARERPRRPSEPAGVSGDRRRRPSTVPGQRDRDRPDWRSRDHTIRRVDLGLSPQWAPGARVRRGDLIDALVDGVAEGDGAALASILLGWGAARQEGVTVSA